MPTYCTWILSKVPQQSSLVGGVCAWAGEQEGERIDKAGTLPCNLMFFVLCWLRSRVVVYRALRTEEPNHTMQSVSRQAIAQGLASSMVYVATIQSLVSLRVVEQAMTALVAHVAAAFARERQIDLAAFVSQVRPANRATLARRI